ncbi:hypothetical protein E4U32_001041 [Claviceps aff. humidiphila group G2b]|nr:hypothetical protein E4U32_001041 [Claviceps aff. humidiphila group G2b]
MGGEWRPWIRRLTACRFRLTSHCSSHGGSSDDLEKPTSSRRFAQPSLPATPMLSRSLLNRGIRFRLFPLRRASASWCEKAWREQSCRALRFHYARSFSLAISCAYDRVPSPSFPAIGDTIYALSTGQGRAGIAVIRISGPSCLQIYHALCPDTQPPKPRRATVRTLFHPKSPPCSPAPDILDSESLILYFPNPRTVTGEDVLELHVHGGPATVKAVLSAIAQCPTTSPTRYAEPGEFTKRAFMNDRLDLAQIESLSDTLDAETEQQRRAAVRGNSGALGRTYDDWREKLLQARGELEALIDFSEDQHFDESQSELLGNVARQVSLILDRMHLHEMGGQRSELLRNGIRIALVGPPNVGKSSLMNMIVGREASIVSGEAGTTRDIVEASLDIRGYLCSFADTAGFRTSGQDVGAVEEEGIRRARRRALESDLVVVLASVERSSSHDAGGEGDGAHCIHFDQETLDLAARAQRAILVVNKRDAVDKDTFSALLDQFRCFVHNVHPQLASSLITMSCKDDAHPTAALVSKDNGLQTVVEALTTAFADMTDMPPSMQDLLGVTERQRQLLAKCRVYLEDFMAEAQLGAGPDTDVTGDDADIVVAAEHLRYAANCLARITGRGEGGDVEDVLGVVFEKFCVGK